jgi:hypothetical protein
MHEHRFDPEVETVLALGPWLHDAYDAARRLPSKGRG